MCNWRHLGSFLSSGLFLVVVVVLQVAVVAVVVVVVRVESCDVKVTPSDNSVMNLSTRAHGYGFPQGCKYQPVPATRDNLYRFTPKVGKNWTEPDLPYE